MTRLVFVLKAALLTVDASSNHSAGQIIATSHDR